MIEVENLRKQYGGKLAVDGVSFTVHAGIVTRFLRPIGAGKSTTTAAGSRPVLRC